MIKSRREGMRFRAFYTTSMQFPAETMYRLTDLQTKILQTIRENTGITQKEITEKLGERQQTINYNVKTMERNGVITLKKVGRTTYCYPNEDEI